MNDKIIAKNCGAKKDIIRIGDRIYFSSVKKAEGSTSGTLISFLFSARPPKNMA